MSSNESTTTWCSRGAVSERSESGKAAYGGGTECEAERGSMGCKLIASVAVAAEARLSVLCLTSRGSGLSRLLLSLSAPRFGCALW